MKLFGDDEALYYRIKSISKIVMILFLALELIIVFTFVLRLEKRVDKLFDEVHQSTFLPYKNTFLYRILFIPHA